MPSEVRHILFQRPEVLDAVREYSRHTDHPFPVNKVLQCEAEKSGEGHQVRLRIQFAPDDILADTLNSEQLANLHVTVPSADLIAALILHCRKGGIPLPARAGKTLRIYGEQICIIATYNSKSDRILKVDGLRS